MQGYHYDSMRKNTKQEKKMPKIVSTIVFARSLSLRFILSMTLKKDQLEEDKVLVF